MHGGMHVDEALIPAPQPGSGEFRVSPTKEVAPDAAGEFRTSCTFSHMSFDDALVYPRRPGEAHLHTFFGNTLADAFSTVDTLRTSGDSTCRGGIANRSAYWVPALIDTATGVPLVPDSIGVYYKNGQFDGSLVTPLPPGLRMIAGDAARTTAPADSSVTRFKCIGGPNNENDKYGPSIGNCDVGAQLWQEIFFPQCWDGVNLDSANHKSHMSYVAMVWAPPRPASEGGAYQIPACPATHPVIIPSITYNVIYNIKTPGAALKWRLSSDMYDAALPAGWSSHGDYMYGWDQSVSDAWGKNCIRAKKDCHSHLLGDGRMVF